MPDNAYYKKMQEFNNIVHQGDFIKTFQFVLCKMRESSGVKMDYYKISGISAASLWKSLYWEAPCKAFEGKVLG